jgi:hypothetical protein
LIPAGPPNSANGYGELRTDADRETSAQRFGEEAIRTTDEPPETDERSPEDVVTAMADRVIQLVATWPAWDGTPRPVDDRVYTPHKAVRRVCDHMVDHLAQVECRLAGVPSPLDHWHGSAITTAADMAAFTPDDADEAVSRLQRLRTLWQLRLGDARALIDERPKDDWTIREIAFHVAESTYYAEAVGDLSDVDAIV